jgi:hypothetical protein
MKAKKIFKISIYVCIILIAFVFIFIPTLLLAIGFYNKPNEPRVTAYEDDLAGKWSQFELVKITIDEIPVSRVKAILIFPANIDVKKIPPHLNKEKVINSFSQGISNWRLPSDLNDTVFSVIGDPNEVGKITGTSIPSDWVIGDFNDVKKITNDFQNATRCKNFSARYLTIILGIYDFVFILWGGNPTDYFGSEAWDYYYNSGVQTVRTDFIKQYAIFITDYRGYALKFAYEGEMNGIWGPDYYSKCLHKDLGLLYNKKNKNFQSGKRMRMGER